MRGRPNPVEALATLARLQDETERRANFRQAITALGQSSGAFGPPPLDGIAPEVLSRVVGLALDTGLVDDLDWIAPDSYRFVTASGSEGLATDQVSPYRGRCR